MPLSTDGGAAMSLSCACPDALSCLVGMHVDFNLKFENY
jgi:hypothetical protein